MRDKQTARSVTSDEVAEYGRNGVVKLPAIFDLGWIDYLRHAVEAAMANPGPDAEEYARGEVAIPTTDPGLQHGDPMDCEDFPVIWRREA